MKETLERGNEGRKWHTLFDKVYSPMMLKTAVKAVTARKGAAGVDGQTTEAFAKREAEEISVITRQLSQGSYEPQPVRRHWIAKRGSKEKRPLGIPTVRDRVVQTALRDVIEPIFEHGFAQHSYGFRPKRSAKDAIKRVEELLKAEHVWVVDADIKGFFDNIPQDKLMAQISEKIADSSILALLKKFLKQGVMETAKDWKPTEDGTPQGAVISPLLANIYLNPLDQQMAKRGREMIRYADDFVILCRTKAEAEEALAEVRAWMNSAGLTLHPEKTKIVEPFVEGSFEFLGWHFERGYRWPREKSIQRLKDVIRQRTKRTNGRRFEEIINNVNRVIRGWGNYFQGGTRDAARKLDEWIRMRLRSILRRREGRRGRARGRDNNRHTNEDFKEYGLTFLITVTHPKTPTPHKT